ncbi:hypothetical protein ElyMa_003627900, partial [Elysia marginata]
MPEKTEVESAGSQSPDTQDGSRTPTQIELGDRKDVHEGDVSGAVEVHEKSETGAGDQAKAAELKPSEAKTAEVKPSEAKTAEVKPFFSQDLQKVVSR